MPFDRTGPWTKEEDERLKGLVGNALRNIIVVKTLVEEEKILEWNSDAGQVFNVEKKIEKYFVHFRFGQNVRI